MNLAGIDAYEQARYDKNGNLRAASESSAGQKTIRLFIERATQAIQRMQEASINKHRTPRNLVGTVLLVPAETAALIVLRSMIDRTYGATEPDVGYNYQVMVKEISKAIELELNFRHWLKSSQEAAKEYANKNGLSKVPKSLAEKLIEESGMHRTSLVRWKKAFEELNTYQWDNLEHHYCGEALLLAVLEELSEVFETHVIFRMGKKQKFVRMTDEYRQRFDQMEIKVAQLQVIRKPMLTKPRKWQKREE